VDLDSLINNLTTSLRHHSFHYGDPDAGFFIAENVHRLGGLENHHTHSFDLDPNAGDGFHILAEIQQGAAKGFTALTTLNHQI